MPEKTYFEAQREAYDTAEYQELTRKCAEAALAHRHGAMCNCPWEMGAGCLEPEFPCNDWGNEKRIQCWRKVYEKESMDTSIFEEKTDGSADGQAEVPEVQ